VLAASILEMMEVCHAKGTWNYYPHLKASTSLAAHTPAAQRPWDGRHREQPEFMYFHSLSFPCAAQPGGDISKALRAFEENVVWLAVMHRWAQLPLEPKHHSLRVVTRRAVGLQAAHCHMSSLEDSY
jgi:hypothetical protein